jgi:hypothetical protein
LGATFYFLLTGRPPFEKGMVAQKLFSHLVEDVEPVGNLRRDVPREVEAVVQRMLAKDPDQRYQTPSEVAEALAGWAAAVPLLPGGEEMQPGRQLLPVRQGTRPAVTGAKRPWRRRQVRAAVGLAVALAVGAILIGAAWWLIGPSPRTVSEVLSAQQASERSDQPVTVVFKVQSVGVNTRGTVFYLNSEKDYRDQKNFAVVIPRQVLDDPEADVTRLRATYEGRHVRVVGTVNRYLGQAQIVVDNLGQVRPVAPRDTPE